MKKTPLLILITLVFLSSCDLLSELTQFDLPYETSFSVPLIGASDSTLIVETPTINTGIADAMGNFNTELDLIDEITLTSLSLTLTEPVDGDFGFLSSMEIFINAAGQEELQLAFNTAVAEDVGAVLNLETTAVDIQEYIKLDGFSLRFSFGTDETVLVQHDIAMNMEVHVDAKVLGL